MNPAENTEKTAGGRKSVGTGTIAPEEKLMGKDAITEKIVGTDAIAGNSKQKRDSCVKGITPNDIDFLRLLTQKPKNFSRSSVSCRTIKETE